MPDLSSIQLLGNSIHAHQRSARYWSSAARLSYCQDIDTEKLPCGKGSASSAILRASLTLKLGCVPSEKWIPLLCKGHGHVWQARHVCIFLIGASPSSSHKLRQPLGLDSGPHFRPCKKYVCDQGDGIKTLQWADVGKSALQMGLILISASWKEARALMRKV